MFVPMSRYAQSLPIPTDFKKLDLYERFEYTRTTHLYRHADWTSTITVVGLALTPNHGYQLCSLPIQAIAKQAVS